MKKYKFVVVGGGTAGIMAATYIKTYWGDNIEVTLIYDHKNPGIGVGESLTPIFNNYLNYVGIKKEEIIKNVNATVKLGLKFKNWLNDGSYFYHNFANTPSRHETEITAYNIANQQYDNDTCHSPYYMENNLLSSVGSYSFHIDATLFSKFVENKFKDKLEIIDDVITEVVKNGDDIIQLITKSGKKITGDFFIDSSGFQSVLMKHMNSEWIDKTDWLPIDRFIPNPVEWDFKEQPCYTTSEASKNGWILQVPLQNRWGSGYLFSSQFTTDEEAFEDFSKWTKNTYGQKLTNNSRVLSFKSGYWKKQWVGNCIAVGLSSGFAEPLEATNIHHVVYQLELFTAINSLQPCEYDRIIYNKSMENFYENAYLYLRFCYTTGRTDSKFWQYITNNTPDIVKQLEKKVKLDYLKPVNIPMEIFGHTNFSCITHGLKKNDPEKIKEILIQRNLYNFAEGQASMLKQKNIIQLRSAFNHKKYIEGILNAEA